MNKPCPFCGGDLNYPVICGNKMFINCDSCGASGSIILIEQSALQEMHSNKTVWNSIVKKAYKEWNKRYDI